MPDSYFPPEIPQIRDAVRITPVMVGYSPRFHKFFCQESYVVSRFFGISPSDRRFIDVSLSGQNINTLRFDLKSSTWSINFDQQTFQVEVEKILE